ncbi:hypothetical protein CJ481_17930 [Bacillus subtilis]|nr:hypothetical protein CJ481_17930 [Bacillus subtilis]
MTFDEVCGLFKQFDGLEQKFLLLSDGSYISVDDFKQRFEGDFNEYEPFTSLQSSPSSTPAWEGIWNKLQEDGLFE